MKRTGDCTEWSTRWCSRVRDWTRTNDLTDVNPEIRDRVVYAILLVVESFNKGRFCKEPWGLICNVIVNEPHQAKLMNLLDVLEQSIRVSIRQFYFRQRRSWTPPDDVPQIPFRN